MPLLVSAAERYCSPKASKTEASAKAAIAAMVPLGNGLPSSLRSACGQTTLLTLRSYPQQNDGVIPPLSLKGQLSSCMPMISQAKTVDCRLCHMGPMLCHIHHGVVFQAPQPPPGVSISAGQAVTEIQMAILGHIRPKLEAAETGLMAWSTLDPTTFALCFTNQTNKGEQ